jgi:FolB domain-containing protein
MADRSKGLDDVVTLKGMRFHTRIGVLPHEAEIAQSVEVDLSVVARREPNATRVVVDYRELYELVAEVMAQQHHLYLEDVAEQIAARVLRAGSVVSTTVAVRKPHVALPGPLSYAEVTVARQRGG